MFSRHYGQYIEVKGFFGSMQRERSYCKLAPLYSDCFKEKAGGKSGKASSSWRKWQ